MSSAIVPKTFKGKGESIARWHRSLNPAPAVGPSKTYGMGGEGHTSSWVSVRSNLVNAEPPERNSPPAPVRWAKEVRSKVVNPEQP